MLKLKILSDHGKLKSRKILGFTPRTKKILENASNEAKKMNSDLIGTEHLLTRNT